MIDEIEANVEKHGGIIVYADNLVLLKNIPDKTIDFIYIDPPFDTGKKQWKYEKKKAIANEHGKHSFGKQYKTKTVETTSGYKDKFEDYIDFLRKRLVHAYRILKDDGSIIVHVDWRHSHHVRMLLDEIFGEDKFMNEIIWAYDYGGKPKRYWARKHDNLFWYRKGNQWTFNYDAIDRIPYMAPSLVGKEKAARGKIPTDTWFITIEPTNSKERFGYPTQKPLKLLERIIRVHTNEGDLVLDFFAGSGTTGRACQKLDRKFIVCDNNENAVRIMVKRLGVPVVKQALDKRIWL